MQIDLSRSTVSGRDIGSLQDLIHKSGTKLGLATRAVPMEAMTDIVPMSRPPKFGEMFLGQVEKIGRHKKLEVRGGYNMDLLVRDFVVGVFGSRYATDQYEGYVPEAVVDMCDVLSVGAVCGELVSRHDNMPAPSRLKILGMVTDSQGNVIDAREFGLNSVAGFIDESAAEVILVVGSAMDSGKTTTVGTIARSLSLSGHKVAAAKITGTATGKDARYFATNGADPALDFTDVGYPSTYMLEEDELNDLFTLMLKRLRRSKPDYIVIEIADGIFQRETRMLLDSQVVRDSVDHVFFAAGDSLAAESGARILTRSYGLPLRATSGALAQSELSVREAEEVTGLPCLALERILDESFTELLKDDTATPMVDSEADGTVFTPEPAVSEA